MAGDKSPQDSKLRASHRELHERLCELGLDSDPTVKHLMDELGDALHTMAERSSREGRSAFLWVPDVEAPAVRSDFARAHAGEAKRKKEPAKAKVDLELRPPGPSGMGQGSRPQVSPQLRDEERDRVREEALEKMRVKRAFRDAARDPIER